jgi:NitT/TauT family transport system permease protein
MTALRRLSDVVLLLGVIVLLWQALHMAAGDVALTGPVETAQFALDLLGRPRFWGHIYESLTAFAYALLISWVGGVGIGVWLGAHRISGEVAEPMLVALYSLPKVTLYPLILLIFGLGMTAKVAFGAIHGIAPVVIFAMNAVRNIRPVYIKTAKTLALSPLDTARTILIPACLPEIVSGLRVGFSLTLLGVLIGEMFVSKRGLGFVIMNAIGLSDVQTMMAVTLILFVFAALINAGLLALDRHLHKRV